MAEQVAHTSFSPFPRVAYRPLHGVAWHISPDTAPAQQESSFVTLGQPLDGHEHTKAIVLQIIDNHRFHTFFVSIKSIIQLDQGSWGAYLHIRNDLAARGFLEPAQPAIWHVPPDEIWQLIVELRQTSAFPALQADILAEVEKAHCRTHLHLSVSQALARSRDRSSYGLATTAFSGSAPVASEASLNTREEFADAAQVLRPRSHPREPSAPPPASLNSAHPKGLDKPPSNRARQAPRGWLYHCPSEGCSKKPYKRLGHYEKHLRKTHPDFGPRHPHHSAQMSLKPRTPSSSSSGHLRDNLQGSGPPAVAGHTHVPASRSSFASRRDSHVSSSSVDSAAVSPSFDDVPESSMFAASDLTVAEATILQDHSVWHTGGGTMMDNMNIDTLDSFYTGLGRD